MKDTRDCNAQKKTKNSCCYWNKSIVKNYITLLQNSKCENSEATQDWAECQSTQWLKLILSHPLVHCWNESSQSVCVVILMEEIKRKRAKMIFSIYSECRCYEILINVIMHWNWYRWDKITFYYRTLYNCHYSGRHHSRISKPHFCGCENPYLTDFLQQRLVWEALERQPLQKYGKLCHSGWKTWNIVLSHRQQISCCVDSFLDLATTAPHCYEASGLAADSVQMKYALWLTCTLAFWIGALMLRWIWLS